MIQSFKSNETKDLFEGKNVKVYESFARVARRKLEMIHAAMELNDLKVPPGNRLEMLRGKRSGEWSIRINDQWRICFIWDDGVAHKVQIENYH